MHYLSSCLSLGSISVWTGVFKASSVAFGKPDPPACGPARCMPGFCGPGRVLSLTPLASIPLEVVLQRVRPVLGSFMAGGRTYILDDTPRHAACLTRGRSRISRRLSHGHMNPRKLLMPWEACLFLPVGAQSCACAAAHPGQSGDISGSAEMGMNAFVVD